MPWEYRIHRFPKKGSIYRDQPAAQSILDDYGQRGWELVSVSDIEALAVFKRRAALKESEREGLAHSLAVELRDLTAAIEELNG